MSDLLVELVPWSLTGDEREQRLYALSLVCLVLGTVLVLAAVPLRRLDVSAVAVASAGIASWLLNTGAREGRTLLVVLPGNGVTTADLLAVPAALLVGVLCWRRLQTPSPCRCGSCADSSA